MTKKGAGCLVARVESDGCLKFLGLIAPIEKRIKSGGIYDLPKGSIKPGETSLECAKRECFEESGILVKDSDIIGYPVSNENVTIYPVIVDQQVKILPNPETGIVEHEGYRWCKSSDLFKNALPWLKPVILDCLSRFSKL